MKNIVSLSLASAITINTVNVYPDLHKSPVGCLFIQVIPNVEQHHVDQEEPIWPVLTTSVPAATGDFDRMILRKGF